MDRRWSHELARGGIRADGYDAGGKEKEVKRGGAHLGGRGLIASRRHPRHRIWGDPPRRQSKNAAEPRAAQGSEGGRGRLVGWLGLEAPTCCAVAGSLTSRGGSRVPSTAGRWMSCDGTTRAVANAAPPPSSAFAPQNPHTLAAYPGRCAGA